MQSSVGLLSRRVSRRGFIARAALAGAAVAVAPRRFLLEPHSAYAAATRYFCDSQCSQFSPGDCTCGDLCCQGWTEFCCATHPETGNSCPPGTIPAGWWRAEGAGLCDVDGVVQPRYYIDCNATCDPGCTSLSGGTCGAACHDFECGCGQNRCDHRKSACTRFRYGQCNDDVPYVGAVVCRYVTCSPPWALDPACEPSPLLFSTQTAYHDRLCLHEREPIHGFFAVQKGRTITLREGHAPGSPETEFVFGAASDVALFGDWNGNRVRTVGVVRGGAAARIGDDRMIWQLRNSNSPGGADIVIEFGQPGETPVVGDFDGDGIDEIGTFRDGVWEWRRGLGGSPTFDTVGFGQAGDIPVVGDWNGDGKATLGVVRGQTWILRSPHGPGSDDVQFTFGAAGAIPVVGDWDGDGIDGPGYVVGASWTIRDDWWTTTSETFTFNGTSDRPLVWGRQVKRT
jgi:hypothetical protein